MKNKIVSLIVLWMLNINIAYAAQTSATISTIVDGLIPQLTGGVHILIFSISYLIGLFLGYKGVIQLKEIGDRGGQKKPITVPLILLVCSALLLSLPTLINTGITTLGFDTGGQQTFKY